MQNINLKESIKKIVGSLLIPNINMIPCDGFSYV